MAKIGIIIPMYNVENFIEKCLYSCINQTFKDIEILAINDESKDNTLEISKRFEQKDNRVKVFNQKNSGVSAARNLGIKNSTAEWLLFLDGDDWLEETALEQMYNEIKDSNDIDILVTSFFSNYNNYEKKDMFLNTEKIFFNKNDKLDLIKNCIYKDKLSSKSSSANLGVPWAKLYKKSFLNKNKINFELGLKRMQDMVFNLYAFYYSNKVKYCNYIYTYHYRLQDKSVTNKYSEDFYSTSIDILKNINRMLEKTQLKNELNIYLQIKALRLYTEIIRLQFVPKECPLKFHEKIKVLREILDKEPYKNIIPLEHRMKLNCKDSLINVLIKLKFIRILYIIYFISYKKKYIMLNKS